MKKFELILTVGLFCLLSYAAWGQATFDPDGLEIRQLDLSDVKGLGQFTHYKCRSQQVAKLSHGAHPQTYSPAEVKKSQGEFHLIYNPGYDISMVNMYDAFDWNGLKNWFLFYGAFKQKFDDNSWYEFDFDINQLIKVPNFIREYQEEAPLDLATPYHFQAYMTRSQTQPPWPSRLKDPIVYAGGAFFDVGQMDVKLISNMTEAGVASLDATYVVVKVSKDFAKRSASPKSFPAEFYVLHRPGNTGSLAQPHVHDVLCQRQKDMGQTESLEVLNNSRTFEWEHFYDGEINIIGAPGTGPVHRESLSNKDLPDGLGADLVRISDAKPPVAAVDQLLLAAARIHQATDFTDTKASLSSWQVIGGAGLTALSYFLWRGANPGLATRSLALPAQTQGSSSWQHPEHTEHSFEEVKALASALLASGGQVPEGTPDTLIEYSLEVAESLRWQQWHQEQCQDNNCI